jgi:RimJ/RimL family protein N-acetyltransferase
VTVLETDRLILRELSLDDFEAVHAYGSDPEVVEHVPWGPNTEPVTWAFLENALRKIAADPRQDFMYAVVAKDTGRLIGSVGIYTDGHQGMLGYAYAREAWGHGYATEAALAMIGMAFDVLLLRRVWASCDPDNTASARVLQKCGMTLEGRLRDDNDIRGRLRDTLVWGILVSEWTSHGESE